MKALIPSVGLKNKLVYRHSTLSKTVGSAVLQKNILSDGPMCFVLNVLPTR